MSAGSIKSKVKKALISDPEKALMNSYFKKYEKYAFSDGNCQSFEQYEGYITRYYHTIEKGLAYTDFRPGFGKKNLERLLDAMEAYAKSFDIEAPFYRTALSVLNEYVEKNRQYSQDVKWVEDRVKGLPGTANNLGGIIRFTPVDGMKADYKTMTESRHSIRHFSSERVDDDLLQQAIQLAQYTPSACNRQGWSTRIISDPDKVAAVLANQNGNRGFGEEIDKLLVITGDLRYFNRAREIFQVYIDGGMYAMSMINALAYYGIAHIPLSASLTADQEKNVRKIAEMDDSEVLILFVGVGNYPDDCQTTRSERKKITAKII